MFMCDDCGRSFRNAGARGIHRYWRHPEPDPTVAQCWATMMTATGPDHAAARDVFNERLADVTRLVNGVG